MTTPEHPGPGSTDRPDRTAMDLLAAAARSFGERVHAVGPDGWSRDTPCAQWSVRDLVNHLTAEHLWVPELLAGRTIAEVGTRFDGDVLGGRPEEAWDAAAEASMQAWRACRPETVVHLSFGDVPAAEYAEQMLLDLLVHGWDLGVAIVRPDRPRLAVMDRVQVVHVLEYVRRHQEELVSSGLFGSPAPDDGGDGPATLLRLLGRDPDWQPHGGAQPTSKPVGQWVTGEEPMTGPQRSYLETLSQEAGEEVPLDLTKAEASELIDRLQRETGRGA